MTRDAVKVDGFGNDAGPGRRPTWTGSSGRTPAGSGREYRRPAPAGGWRYRSPPRCIGHSRRTAGRRSGRAMASPKPMNGVQRRAQRMVHQVQEGLFGAGGIAGRLPRQAQFLFRAPQVGDVLVDADDPLDLRPPASTWRAAKAADVADFAIGADDADLLGTRSSTVERSPPSARERRSSGVDQGHHVLELRVPSERGSGTLQMRAMPPVQAPAALLLARRRSGRRRPVSSISSSNSAFMVVDSVTIVERRSSMGAALISRRSGPSACNTENDSCHQLRSPSGPTSIGHEGRLVGGPIPLDPSRNVQTMVRQRIRRRRCPARLRFGSKYTSMGKAVE